MKTYTIETCPDDLLLMQCTRMGLIAAPEDWHPSPPEIREHDCDLLPIRGMGLANKLVQEIAKRGLQGRTINPW